MEPSRGKPVATSVPSISIKFHANVEQLEELYASDEEQGAQDISATAGIGEPESSPLKYFPRLVKRSTSIDITPTANIDASPPSDPWRFFSDIKGKITKSVEEKITEIKARNQEEGSPLKSKSVKDSKDNSSVSDSEELSESSISKTCGIVSTTEGAEMSSDDDTPSIENDKNLAASSGLRQRFRLLKPKSGSKEGTINKRNLSSLYNINADKIEQAFPEETDIESAVDALEDSNLQNGEERVDVLKGLEQQFDNIKVDDDNVVNVKEMTGNELRQANWMDKTPKTVFAPVGFVDFRTRGSAGTRGSYIPIAIIIAILITYILIHTYSTYLAGCTLGVLVTYLIFHFKSLLDTPTNTALAIPGKAEILQVPAVKEFQPLNKYEGWVNEFPETYNPHTYHISQTQSVYLRLQGNLLRISHTKSKVPKRALWNEPKIKPTFTHHRVYNLLGAQIALLPQGLAKKRHWSKKYPICITLSKDQMNFEPSPTASTNSSVKEEEDEGSKDFKDKPKRFGFGGKKKKVPLLSQRFSKLTEENEEFEMDSENSRASTPSPIPSPRDESEDRLAEEDTQKLLDEILEENIKEDELDVLAEEEFDSLPEDWGTFTSPDEDSPTETKIYIFGRTDREKEDWFRKLKAATHKGANVFYDSSHQVESVSQTLLDKAMTETDYVKFMSAFHKARRIKADSESAEDSPPDVQWVNLLVGRILFDCLRDDNFTQKVKDKIQKKIGTIKLPYFIEGLNITELNLGRTPPLIHRAMKPIIDERGLWIDLDITYEGLIVLILQTKLNLMKLKTRDADKDENRCHCLDENKTNDRPAMFNSDVEDSAESTSDEEAICPFQNPPALDSAGFPVQGLGGTSNTSKKFIKMVDKIAESKFFQSATEYRYIKKAMESVSNTDLRLKVEVKELVGTLVLNIPTPPSDRVWIGFRPTPNLALSAQPIVGERNITYLRITSWIEKKLLLEFQKLMVIPNMEDFVIPVMSQKLPE